MRQKRIIWFVIMIALGAGLGMLYGWVINPVKYVDTTPGSLRSDYQADYVLMVAQIYAGDGDLEQATRRLAGLSSQPAAQVVAEAIITGRALEYDLDDLDMMNRLAQALTSQSPSTGSQP